MPNYRIPAFRVSLVREGSYTLESAKKSEDSCWGIVVENDKAKVEELAKEMF